MRRAGGDPIAIDGIAIVIARKASEADSKTDAWIRRRDPGGRVRGRDGNIALQEEGSRVRGL